MAYWDRLLAGEILNPEAGASLVRADTELFSVELMDRVLVFREGHVFWELPRAMLSREALVAAFFGNDPTRHA